MKTAQEYKAQQSLIDQSTPGIMYIGKSDTGTKTDSPFWQIQRIKNEDNLQTISYADGYTLFGYSWDKRSTYNYEV